MNGIPFYTNIFWVLAAAAVTQRTERRWCLLPSAESVVFSVLVTDAGHDG